MNLNGKIHYSPWPFFIVVFIANALLSWCSFPLDIKASIWVFGVLVPYLIGLSLLAVEPPVEFKTFPGADLTIGNWILVPLMILAVSARFYRLSDLSFWPLMDEGRNSFFSMKLLEHWDWRMFYDISQLPPFYYWALSSFYRIFPPSLTSLWVFAALVSLVLPVAAFLAARLLFPKFYAWVLCVLFALSFWPLYSARFAVQGPAVLAWEMLTFVVLAYFATSVNRRELWAVLLGVVTGIGFYVHLHWPLMALSVWLVVHHFSKQEKERRLMFRFLAPLLLIALPLAVMALHQGYGDYLKIVLNGDSRQSGGDRIEVFFSYLTAFFWGVKTDMFSYRPVLGGFLNPLLGASLGVGALEAYRMRSHWAIRWMTFSLVLFLVPGFLTSNLETFRVVLVLPFLLAVSAWGLLRLGQDLSGSSRWVFLAALLLISSGFDLYRLVVEYPRLWLEQTDWASYGKSKEQWRAFEFYRSAYARYGKGYIFSEFDSYPMDRSMVTAAYPMNVIQTDMAERQKAKWAGFITNESYRPFLSRRFPKAQWTRVSNDGKDPVGGFVACVLPLDENDRQVVEKWRLAEKFLSDTTFSVLNHPIGRSRKDVIDRMFQGHALFQGDPFLESVFWDLVYLNFSVDDRPADSYQALEIALQKGYPTSYFYNELGVLMMVKGDRQGAKIAFEKAVAAPGDHAQATENLNILSEQLSKERSR